VPQRAHVPTTLVSKQTSAVKQKTAEGYNLLFDVLGIAERLKLAVEMKTVALFSIFQSSDTIKIIEKYIIAKINK
jgi:hypothetical protein